MAEKVWTICYWPKGQCRTPANTTIMPLDGLTYNEARARAKRARYIPAFFGYNVAPERLPAADD